MYVFYCVLCILFFFIYFLFTFVFFVFFFKQKTAYEMRISDWSSDVCSSDLFARGIPENRPPDRSIWRTGGDRRNGSLVAVGCLFVRHRRRHCCRWRLHRNLNCQNRWEPDYERNTNDGGLRTESGNDAS